MKKKLITRKRLDDPSSNHPVGWDRVDLMTDAEVHRSAVADPDAQPEDDEFFETGVVMTPEAFQEFVAGKRKRLGRKIEPSGVKP